MGIVCNGVCSVSLGMGMPGEIKSYMYIARYLKFELIKPDVGRSPGAVDEHNGCFVFEKRG
jgi:hypothetical protein